MQMTAIECRRKHGSRYLMTKAIKAGELQKVATGIYSDGSGCKDGEARIPLSARNAGFPETEDGKIEWRRVHGES